MGLPGWPVPPDPIRSVCLGRKQGLTWRFWLVVGWIMGGCLATSCLVIYSEGLRHVPWLGQGVCLYLS